MTVMLSISAAPVQAPPARADRGAKAGTAQENGFASTLAPSQGEPRRKGQDELSEGEAGAQAKLSERLSVFSRLSEAERKGAGEILPLPDADAGTEADAEDDAALPATEVPAQAEAGIVIPGPAGSIAPDGATADATAIDGTMPAAGKNAAGRQPPPQVVPAQAAQVADEGGTARAGEAADPAANTQPRTAAAIAGDMTGPANVAAARRPVTPAARNMSAAPVTVVEPEATPAGERPSAPARQLSSTLGAAAVGKPADAALAPEPGGTRAGTIPQSQQSTVEPAMRGTNASEGRPTIAADRQPTLARGTTMPTVPAKGGQEAAQPVAAAAPTQPASPAQTVVSALRADPELRAGAGEATTAAAQHGFAARNGLRSLKIQLHPAELGMVTARLARQGAQLSIELQVESDEARQRLSSDSDTIVKALRGLGFDIDRVSIQQASATPASNGQQPGSASRDGAFQSMGNGDKGAEGRSSDGRPDAQTGGGHGNGGREKPGAASRDGIYI